MDYDEKDAMTLKRGDDEATLFLDASSYLYERVWLSIRPFVFDGGSMLWNELVVTGRRGW